jgi:hypothetical protein
MSKRSLPRLDLLLLPFRGGDNDGSGNDGNESSKDKDGSSKDKGDDGSSKDKDKDEDEDEDDDDDDLAGITDPRDRRIAELSREAARRRREKNANKKEVQRLQGELDALKSGKGTEQEQWETEKTSLEQRYEELLTNTSNTVLRNAVKDPDNKYSWYDVPVVMGLVNRDAIEIDLEEGVVDGLEAELKRIAKEKPYLVKKSTAGSGNSNNGNDGKGSGSGGTGSTGSTGNNPSGRNSSNDAKAAQRATLERNYPGLNV